jgi:propanol-preferring alcohol dehydrogenase
MPPLSSAERSGVLRALELDSPALVETQPLVLRQRARPKPEPGQLLVRVLACAVCRTDLHLVEGDLRSPAYPRVPGHQIAGEVIEIGGRVEGWRPGDRVGVPWLHRTCGTCEFCQRGEENLCQQAVFTGLHVDGGFAEYMLAEAAFSLHLPAEWSPEKAAPLLCAGIIGFRSLRKADLAPGERLGLVGFGASAHLALQVAAGWDCPVFVFTRSEAHRRQALSLGAAWAGTIDDLPPVRLDRAIIFAPAGELVPAALAHLRPGGTLAINAIHMSPIPSMPYERIYGERTLRSVANATFRDGVEFLALARQRDLRVSTQTYPLERANQALADLKASRLDGAAVLIP